VAITIRNKETEDLIRRIGRRTGEEPDAMMLRLVKADAGPGEVTTPVSPDEVARRMARMEELRLKYTYPDDPKLSWAEIEEEMDSIFGPDLDDPFQSTKP
jgi:hypothetical protein